MKLLGAGCSEGAAVEAQPSAATEQRTYSIRGFSGAPSPQQTTRVRASLPLELFGSVDFH